jgi:hypothetical protein
VLRIGVLVAVVRALLLAGCGTLQAGAGAIVGRVSASSAPPRWVSYGPDSTQIVSVSIDSSGRVLTIAANVLAGRRDCERDLAAGVYPADPKLSAKLGEPVPKTDFIWVTYQSLLDSALGECRSTQVKTARVRLPAPLGQWTVVINSDETFASGHGALLRKCGIYGCEPVIEPPATCTTPSYQEAMLSTGPPQGATSTARGCDGHWLVLDVYWPGGPVGCDAPCHPAMAVTRWFFQAGPHGWMTIASTLAAGCTRVRSVQPRFPSPLCAGLPAPG